MFTFNIAMDSLLNAVYTASSGGSSAEFDMTQAVNNSLFINVAARAGGTNSASITVEHSSSSGSGFSAVPASALYNPSTGSAASFANVTTAATDETLALNLQQCKRYIRVTIAGTTITQNFAVTVAYQKHYTEA